MSRTNPDLFEFFGKRRGKPTTSARAVSTPTRDGGGAVVTLSRRLATLLAAGAVLLTALAFVGGLAVGRGMGGATGLHLVNKPKVDPPSATWLLRGTPLPRISNQSDSLEHRALAFIREKYPQLAPFLSSGPVEAGRGRVEAGRFRLIVRGFPSEASATAWAKALSTERVGEYHPFRDCRPERAPN